jgi:hypothetical protein
MVSRRPARELVAVAIGARGRGLGRSELHAHSIEVLPHYDAAAGHTIEGQIEFRGKRTNAVGQRQTGALARHVSHRAYDDGIRVIAPDHPFSIDPVPRVHSPFGAYIHRNRVHSYPGAPPSCGCETIGQVRCLRYATSFRRVHSALHPRLCPKPPVGPDWIHEIKHDGYRLQVRDEAAMGDRPLTCPASSPGRENSIDP